MAQFEPGKIIKTEYGTPVKIVKELGEGGQGEVYLVEYNGKNKALKWYKTGALINPDKFYKNLKNNVDKGSPGRDFLWPEVITERIENSFGYIMDLAPDGYYELETIFASKKVNFKSFRVAVDACLRIISAFRVLHGKGYSYQDLNAGNFFIEPNTGDVLICDNDNVAPNGTDTGILGTPRFMAPEVVLNRTMPNNKTDFYSLSVILFYILLLNHPLEGIRWIKTVTPKAEKMLYGNAPLFIFDEKDNSNRPLEGEQNVVIKRWGCMPKYLKDEFLRAFNQEALRIPDKRLTESDWIDVLVRFRGNIAECSCGNEVFLKDDGVTNCDECGKTMIVKHTIKLPNYSVAAVKNSCIYRCQVLGMCNPGTELNHVAKILVGPNGDLGLQNMTGDILEVYTSGGALKQIKPKEIIFYRAGIKIKIDDSIMELH